MRDGIFSFYIRSDETAIRAIAIVENDSIRGFNRSHIYSVERLEYSLDRLQKKDRNTNWRVKAMEHAPIEGVSVRGLPARLEGEEGEEQFWFEGGLMQTSASGLKSKERGFKIFRGIAQHTDRSEARLGCGDFSYLRKGNVL